MGHTCSIGVSCIVLLSGISEENWTIQTRTLTLTDPRDVYIDHNQRS